MLNDKSDKLGTDYGSSGTYSFRVQIRVRVMVRVFVPTESEFKGNILRLTCLYQKEPIPQVVDSSQCFSAQFPYSVSKFKNSY